MQPKSKPVKVSTAHAQHGEASRYTPLSCFVTDNSEVSKITQIMHALADETRVKIVIFLAKQAEGICVCTIVDQFQLDQSTISHHLRSLRKVGIINGVRKGVCIYYHFCVDALIPLTAFLETLGKA